VRFVRRPRRAALVLVMVALITVSNSEGGYERTDQGAVLMFRWPITLEPGQAWEETTRAEIAGPWVKPP
jgi:hypothetical protein